MPPIEVAFRVVKPNKPIEKKDTFKGSDYKGIIMVEDKKEKSEPIDFSLSNFVDYGDESPSYNAEPVKHRGRPKKETPVELTNSVKEKNKAKTPLNSDMTYQSTYGTTNALLAQSISQIDDLSSKIDRDLQEVRHSKTLKRKYDYICELSGTMTGLMGNKINAVREMNNTITNAHKLELSKTKELKMNDQVDDDKRIMDLYNAYINAPVGTMMPSMSSPYTGMNAAQLNSPISTMVSKDNVNSQSTDDAGFDNYMNNLSPQQNAMLLESNPNIKTIVVFNQTNQERFFRVIDTQTGQDVPNMPVPSDQIRDALQIDIKNGCARSLLLNTSYELQLIGDRAMDEY